MKKFIASLMAVMMVLPGGVWAAESTDDLVLILPEDFTVKAGEEFSIPVLAAYDETEDCTEFYYDWRQTEGVEVSPLNEDVKEPVFQINTPGVYIFSLTIREQCNVEADVSATEEVSVTVLERTEAETKNYEKQFLPSEVTLAADGMSWQVFNLFLTNTEASASEEKYPSGEEVEFLLKTDDEVLKENTGRFLLSGNTLQNGILTFTYYAPLIEDESFTGGDVVIQAAMVQGTITVTVHLTPAKNTFEPKVTVSQVLDSAPYLVKNKDAIVRVGLKWPGEEIAKTAQVAVFVNDQEVKRETKEYEYTYTDTEKAEHEDVVYVQFTPKKDKVTVRVEMTVGTETQTIIKELQVRETKSLELKLAALAEEGWEGQETVDVSGEFADEVAELLAYVPTAEVVVGDLTTVPAYVRADLPEDALVLLPEGFTGTLPTEMVYQLGGEESLAVAYLSRFAGSEELGAAGVKLVGSEFTVLDGEGETLFAGGETLTRGVFDKLLALLAGDLSFKDLNADHWAMEDLKTLVANGVLGGYTDGTLRPNTEVTRAEFLKMMLAAGGSSVIVAQGNAGFADVAEEAWYAPYVELALKKGLVKGYADGTFGVTKPVTRAEAMKILVLYAGFDVPEDLQETSFSDVSAEDWFAPYVEVMVQKGVVGGYDDGTFRPSASITRAEAAKILARLFY